MRHIGQRHAVEHDRHGFVVLLERAGQNRSAQRPCLNTGADNAFFVGHNRCQQRCRRQIANPHQRYHRLLGTIARRHAFRLPAGIATCILKLRLCPLLLFLKFALAFFRKPLVLLDGVTALLAARLSIDEICQQRRVVSPIIRSLHIDGDFFDGGDFHHLRNARSLRCAAVAIGIADILHLIG